MHRCKRSHARHFLTDDPRVQIPHLLAMKASKITLRQAGSCGEVSAPFPKGKILGGGKEKAGRGVLRKAKGENPTPHTGYVSNPRATYHVTLPSEILSVVGRQKMERKKGKQV